MPPETGDVTTVADHTKWTSGNFEIITVDNVRFRVPDYVLFGAR